MGDHDLLFKRAFGVPEHAAGELRAVLPEPLVAALDWAALEPLPGSFVDPQMAERLTDLLFRVPMLGSEQTAYVYLLLEHQSGPDPLMAFRVLGYLHRIWSAVLRNEADRSTLPLLIPVVVHHGEQPWAAPRRLHALVEHLARFPELGALVPDFELVIDDLATQRDEDLARRSMSPFPKVALWLLRDGRDIQAFLEHLVAWAGELERLVGEDRGYGDVDVVVRYILRVAGDTAYDVVRTRIAQVAPAMEEPMASAAERLIEQGIQRGTRATLHRLLRARFGALPTQLEQRLASASGEELDRATERILTAERAEDVFEP